MERLFVLKTLSRSQRVTKICGDLPETTAFKSYAANQYSDLPAVSFHSAKHQRVPHDCRQHSALPKTMPTDAANPRTKSTTLQLHARCGQIPRTRISTVQSSMQYARAEGFALHWFFLRVLKLAIF